MKQSRFGAWVLFGLLTVAGILNLVDRQIISVLKPEISQELNWTADDYGTLGTPSRKVVSPLQLQDYILHLKLTITLSGKVYQSMR